MSLVSSALPSLANGVSQQPATARLSSQGETQENGYSSIVEGNGKRSPTHHIAKMVDAGDVPSGAFLHMINRDTDERYSVIIANGAIRVFDLDGNEKTVTDNSDDDYLTADDDTTAFRAVTIADYTFLLNKEKTVEMAPHGSTYLVTIRAVHAGGTYSVDFSQVVDDNASSDGTFNTAINLEPYGVASVVANNTATTAQLASLLNTEINAMPAGDASKPWSSYFNCTVNSNILTITAPAGLPFALYIDQTAPAVEDDMSLVASDLGLQSNYQGLVYVKQGNYATNYSVTVAGAGLTSVTVTNQTSNTDITKIQTDNIAGVLNTLLWANAVINTNFITTQIGSSIKILLRTDSTATAFSISVADSNGNKNIVAVKERIQKFTDLPPQAPPYFLIQITGDQAAEEDDYFVRFKADDPASSIGTGIWEELVDPSSANQFDRRTMPHQLVREADGTFTFQRAEFLGRRAGDEDTNPEPSFVGKQMNDIVFFRNRLGFLADENVILSAAGPNYFRFWRQTVTAILDGDPIDVAASNVSVSILRNAVPYSQDKMLLFSDQKQFILSGGDLLTPKTTSIKPSTSYESLIDCKPVTAGKAVYFPTPRGDNAGLREYSTDQTTATDDAVDVTAHVPAYIPANVFKIATCGNEDVLFLLTRDDPTSIYVYKYYFVANDKLQASWSKWTSSGTILDANFIETTCYLAIEREDGIYLESVSIEAFRNDVNMDYEILLDRRFTAGPSGLVTGTYDANTNLTTFALPYETSETVQAVVRDDGAIPAGYYESQMLAVTKVAGNTSITIAGDVSAVPLIIGVQYQFLYEFSEITVKQASGQGGERPLTGGRLQIRLLDLVFDRTGYFRVTVTPTNGDTYTYQLTPKILGQYVTGSLVLQDGSLKIPVLAKSDQVTIQVINDSPFPSHLLSASWIGEFILKGRRM